MDIEGRWIHVDRTNFVFEVKEAERDGYDFIVGDIFGTRPRQFVTSDAVLCPVLMYHVSNHMELLEKICEVHDGMLLKDTTPLQGSRLRAGDRAPQMRTTRSTRWTRAGDETNEAGHPRPGRGIRLLGGAFKLGLPRRKGEPRQTGCHDYHGGTWRAFTCAK
jgi:hypothetical protein